MFIWMSDKGTHSARERLARILTSVPLIISLSVIFLATPAVADQAFRVPTSDRLFVGSVKLPGGHYVGFEARENSMVTVEDRANGFKYAIVLSSPTRFGEPFNEGIVDGNVFFDLRLYRIDRLGDLSEAPSFVEHLDTSGQRSNCRESPTYARHLVTTGQRSGSCAVPKHFETSHGMIEVRVERIKTYPFLDKELRDYLKSLDPSESSTADLLEAYFGTLSGTTCCVTCNGSATCGTVVHESCGSCRSPGGGGDGGIPTI